MAKKEQLYDRATGEEVYPITHSNCIVTEDSSNVATEKTVDIKIADTLESSPAIVEAVTELKNKLNDDEDVAVSVEKQIAEAKMKLFIDEWNTKFGIWGKYNEETGYFEGNGLTDITYEQARTILAAGPLFGDSLQIVGSGAFAKLRTNQPSQRVSHNSYNVALVTLLTSAMICREVVNINPYNSESPMLLANQNLCEYTIQCPYVLGVIDVSKVTGWPIRPTSMDVPKIRHILYKGIKTHVYITSKYIDFESIKFALDNAANTTQIDFKVHADIFAALTGEATYPFNGGTREEWEQLMLDAPEKLITFAV